jgi:glutamine amidotransferase
MCRHVGYLGDLRTLASIVTAGPTSLLRQSYEPRRQRHGTVNADGWGVGWFTDTPADGPARHRSVRPIWSDPFVADVAPHVRSGSVVAAVRSATPPAPIEESGAAPFTDGCILFSHNGAVDDFVDRIGPVLRRTLAPDIEGAIVGAADSEVLFACVRQAHRSGSALPEAVAHTVHAVLAITPARLNLLVG